MGTHFLSKKVSDPSSLLRSAAPATLRSPRRMHVLQLNRNRLSGSLPNAVLSCQKLSNLIADSNDLSHCFPSFLISLPSLIVIDLDRNHFTGSLFDGDASAGMMTRIKPVFSLIASHNSITGSLPSGMPAVASKLWLDLSGNLLKGALPYVATLHVAPYVEILLLRDNMIAGSIPQGLSKLTLCDVTDNKLTGNLPVELFNPDLAVLRCSGNSLEGSVPQWFQVSKLEFLAMVGLVAPSAHLTGPLPFALGRALLLNVLLAHNQVFEDSIPSLASTLNMLTAHRNSLRALPDLRFVNKVGIRRAGSFRKEILEVLQSTQSIF